MHIIENYRENRSSAIKKLPLNSISEFLSKNVLGKLKEAKKQARRPIISDIDDALLHAEPWLRARLNAYFLNQVPNFKPVSLNDVLEAGGRYFQVQRLQDAAEILGKKFSQIWKELDSDPEIYSFMRPTQSRQQMVKDFTDNGFSVVGYLTARPDSLMEITAKSLAYFEFDEAPVINTNGSSADPSDAKVKFFEGLLSQTTIQDPIIFIDDHVNTALAIQKRLERRVIPVVPIVPRNENMIETLKKHDVLYGFPHELCSLVLRRLS